MWRFCAARSRRKWPSLTIIDRKGVSQPRIPKALEPIELRNEATGWQGDGRSDATGQFRIAELSPGRYQITIIQPGFQKYTQTATVEETVAEMIPVASQTNATASLNGMRRCRSRAC